jgi:integrase/recombinase XerD
MGGRCLCTHLTFVVIPLIITHMNTQTAPGGSANLARLLEIWTASLRSRSPNTARSYHHCVRRFLDELTGELREEDVATYLDSLADLAPASRAHHVSAVRSFLKFAQGQGAIERSPVDLLVRPRVSVTSLNRYLDEDELRKLVAAARKLGPRHFAAVLLLAGTGIRVGEASTARWRDLFRDPQGRLGLRVVGKGGKERVVKIRDDVFAALIALHGTDKLDARDDHPVLPSTRAGGTVGYSQQGLWNLVAQAVEQAGIDKPASPHWLRHTHATLAAHGGASSFEIRDALGHSRLETSQRYVHAARGLEKTTVDALPAFE